jgi:hypothetical protein
VKSEPGAGTVFRIELPIKHVDVHGKAEVRE